MLYSYVYWVLTVWLQTHSLTLLLLHPSNFHTLPTPLVSVMALYSGLLCLGVTPFTCDQSGVTIFTPKQSFVQSAVLCWLCPLPDAAAKS